MVMVRGNWIPRQVCGRLSALCAAVRMLWISLRVLLEDVGTGVVVCDGVSAPVPLLRLVAPVLFYCHFPDKLLCRTRGSLLRRAYRLPLDMLEELTTGMASMICVNSAFTATVFQDSFKMLRRHFPAPAAGVRAGAGAGTGALGGSEVGGQDPGRLRVLYPPTDIGGIRPRGAEDQLREGEWGPVVSLNRFERKKNLPLAIEAVAWAQERLAPGSREKLRLVVAGGYDPRVAENVEHLEELRALVAALGLEGRVDFRVNIGDDERTALLRSASCVLYTPAQEHFGIVPVEAMCSGAPVVAVSSGGPLETVVDGSTGFLREASKEAFGEAIKRLVSDPGLQVSMGVAGRKRVEECFSLESFSQALDDIFQELVFSQGPLQPGLGLGLGSWEASLALGSFLVAIVAGLVAAILLVS
ncbi:unnamed protein product [Discosporangium mesarthrocarpum]